MWKNRGVLFVRNEGGLGEVINTLERRREQQK